MHLFIMQIRCHIIKVYFLYYRKVENLFFLLVAICRQFSCSYFKKKIFDFYHVKTVVNFQILYFKFGKILFPSEPGSRSESG